MNIALYIIFVELLCRSFVSSCFVWLKCRILLVSVSIIVAEAGTFFEIRLSSWLQMASAIFLKIIFPWLYMKSIDLHYTANNATECVKSIFLLFIRFIVEGVDLLDLFQLDLFQLWIIDCCSNITIFTTSHIDCQELVLSKKQWLEICYNFIYFYVPSALCLN